MLTISLWSHANKLKANTGTAAGTAAALALLLAACAKDPAPAAAPAAPRDQTPVIIYLIDTLRADRLGLYGYDKPTSPNIDALASESVVFEQAHSTAPWTLPSLTSILTSRYPCEHGLLKGGLKLSPALPTLTEHLQGLGYATVAHYQNMFAGPMAGLDRGFQISEYAEMRESDLAGRSRNFLRNAPGGPFLLYLHSMEPHNAFHAPSEHILRFGHAGVDDRERFHAYYDAYRLLLNVDTKQGRAVGTTDATADLRKLMNDIAAMRRQVEVMYDGAVSFADERLGQTIAALRESGAWDRALFILMADHGEELEDHNGWFHDQSVYEELIHVPLLVHFPKGAHGGRRIKERVSLLDVMPTVLDYLGRAELCKDCRGASLLPLVEGRDGYRAQELPTMRHNISGYYRPLKESKGDVNVVVRDGPVKGIWNEEPDRVELYDLDTDPGEQRDLSAARGAEAKSVAGRAREWLEGCRATLVPPDEMPKEEMTDELRQQLRAHGYFGG